MKYRDLVVGQIFANPALGGLFMKTNGASPVVLIPQQSLNASKKGSLTTWPQDSEVVPIYTVNISYTIDHPLHVSAML